MGHKEKYHIRQSERSALYGFLDKKHGASAWKVVSKTRKAKSDGEKGLLITILIKNIGQ